MNNQKEVIDGFTPGSGQSGRTTDESDRAAHDSGLRGYHRATKPPPSCDKLCPCPDHQRDGTGVVVYVPDNHDQQQTESPV